MRYTIVVTSVFKKDIKVVKKRNKDLRKLKKVIDTLASGQLLEEKYHDHQLVNTIHYKNCRECHIEPDWLLIYRIDNNDLILLLIETGSHSDLF